MDNLVGWLAVWQARSITDSDTHVISYSHSCAPFPARHPISMVTCYRYPGNQDEAASTNSVSLPGLLLGTLMQGDSLHMNFRFETVKFRPRDQGCENY